MSDLIKIMEKYCPQGVRYRSLGDISTGMYRGSGIKRNQITETGIPCVRYGEIYTTYGIWFEKCVSHTDESMIDSKKYFEHGDILFAITGENVEDIARCTAYLGQERCLAGGDILVMKHTQNPKYLSYALSTTDAKSQKTRGKVKSKVVHASISSIESIVIPLPPLEVQDEIVRILDSFTSLTAELTAELTARKLQYEFYRDKLLSFDHLTPEEREKAGVRWMTLGSLAEIGTGSYNTNDGLEQGEYPFFVRSQETRRMNSYEYDETAIITSGDGVGVGKIFHYVEGKYALHQRAYRIHPVLDCIRPRFLFHYMRSTFGPYIRSNAVHASVTSIRLPMLERYPVPVIPLEEQDRIVMMLDRFEALCYDISIGIPAEIEARHKQYEYYRDKLLSFMEVSI